MLVLKKEIENGVLLFWEIQKNLEELITQFKEFNNFEEELKALDKFKSKQRKLEWLSVRLAINNFFKKKTKVYYDNFGKPFLKNNYAISISHSKNLIVVALSKNNEIGIDVELVSDKIKRIAHKFLHKEEIEQIEIKEDKLKLHIYWSAKEALYKVYGKKELSFINNLRIEAVNENKDSFVGHLIIEENTISYKMQYFEYNEFIVVWTKEQNKK